MRTRSRALEQTWIKYFFDTTGFFEGQNLTRKHRDSRQNVNGNKRKKQSFKGYFRGHIGLFNIVIFKLLPNLQF